MHPFVYSLRRLNSPKSELEFSLSDKTFLLQHLLSQGEVPSSIQSPSSKPSLSHPHLTSSAIYQVLLTLSLDYLDLFISLCFLAPPSSKLPLSLRLAIASALVSPVSTCSVRFSYRSQSDEVLVISHWLRLAFQTLSSGSQSQVCTCSGEP